MSITKRVLDLRRDGRGIADFDHWFEGVQNWRPGTQRVELRDDEDVIDFELVNSKPDVREYQVDGQHDGRLFTGRMTIFLRDDEEFEGHQWSGSPLEHEDTVAILNRLVED